MTRSETSGAVGGTPQSRRIRTCAAGQLSAPSIVGSATCRAAAAKASSGTPAIRARLLVTAAKSTVSTVS